MRLERARRKATWSTSWERRPALLPMLPRSEEHTSELQSPCNLVCRLLLEKKTADARQHPSGVRLRACAAHHAQVDCQQRRDRRHLGAVAGASRAASAPRALRPDTTVVVSW